MKGLADVFDELHRDKSKTWVMYDINRHVSLRCRVRS